MRAVGAPRKFRRLSIALKLTGSPNREESERRTALLSTVGTVANANSLGHTLYRYPVHTDTHQQKLP